MHTCTSILRLLRVCSVWFTGYSTSLHLHWETYEQGESATRCRFVGWFYPKTGW
ncbi:hypothetical protein M758_7G140300 [Ceratodon purpureus]|nr:hypothetical protein M758_7G140300 [Ceratodon purpureus]